MPVCELELCRVKTKLPVPPVALVVPPVTVKVSDDVRPTVVEIVELDIEAEGGPFTRIVRPNDAVFAPSVAVKVSK